jgi:hypothetical protein
MTTPEEWEALGKLYKSGKLSLSKEERALIFCAIGNLVYLEALATAIGRNPATKAAVETLWEDIKEIQQSLQKPFEK